MQTYSNFKRAKVLGVNVDMVNREETLKKISDQIENPKNKGVMQVVTAYSEFFVTAGKDLEFRKVLNNAELVVPDGVGPLAAIDYSQSINSNDSFLIKILKGGVTGLKVLTGKVGKTVSGLWLCSKLIELASDHGWKVFLLGGFGDVSYRLEKKFFNNYPDLKIKSDPGEQDLDLKSGFTEILSKINAFKPDLLFVAYGPVKQEKWVAKNKKNLQAKVAIGVGGTFDELTEKVAPVPKLLEKMGLKWLWRVKEEPKRFRRILNAFPIFPFMVFRETFKR